MKHTRFIPDSMPLCECYDSRTCEFSNGDTVYIVDSDVSGMAYKSGYLLDVEWYDHETEMCWTGITLNVQMGSVECVSYVELSEDGEYVENVEIDELAGCLDTPLYLDDCDEWRSYLKACMLWM